MKNPAPHTAPEILVGLREAIDHCQELCETFTEEEFNHRGHEKWSAAQNLDHLIKSTEPLTQGLGLPSLTFRAFGKPNRPVRSYDEVVSRYLAKLAEGGVATGPYTASTGELDQEALLGRWQKATQALLNVIESKWSEEEKLDKFLLPHPLLGKLMVREMLFFTLYHTWHHIRAIEVQSQSID